jgi:hypothetical protein
MKSSEFMKTFIIICILFFAGYSLFGQDVINAATEGRMFIIYSFLTAALLCVAIYRSRYSLKVLSRSPSRQTSGLLLLLTISIYVAGSYTGMTLWTHFLALTFYASCTVCILANLKMLKLVFPPIILPAFLIAPAGLEEIWSVVLPLALILSLIRFLPINRPPKSCSDLGQTCISQTSAAGEFCLRCGTLISSKGIRASRFPTRLLIVILAVGLVAWVQMPVLVYNDEGSTIRLYGLAGYSDLSLADASLPALAAGNKGSSGLLDVRLFASGGNIGGSKPIEEGRLISSDTMNVQNLLGPTMMQYEVWSSGTDTHILLHRYAHGYLITTEGFDLVNMDYVVYLPNGYSSQIAMELERALPYWLVAESATYSLAVLSGPLGILFGYFWIGAGIIVFLAFAFYMKTKDVYFERISESIMKLNAEDKSILWALSKSQSSLGDGLQKQHRTIATQEDIENEIYLRMIGLERGGFLKRVITIKAFCPIMQWKVTTRLR